MQTNASDFDISCRRDPALSVMLWLLFTVVLMSVAGCNDSTTPTDSNSTDNDLSSTDNDSNSADNGSSNVASDNQDSENENSLTNQPDVRTLTKPSQAGIQPPPITTGLLTHPLSNANLQISEKVLLSGHQKSVYYISFSPNSKLLASPSDDMTIKIWDTATGELKHTLIGHLKTVWQTAFSPDGTTLASASSDKTVILWDPSSGEIKGSLSGFLHQVVGLAFSPDGATLAVGTGVNDQPGELQLWDVASLKKTAELTGQSERIQTLAYSPDGTMLASGGGNETRGELILWDIATGRIAKRLIGSNPHIGWVVGVAFSPDGHTLASCGFDRNRDTPIRLWNVASGELKEAIRKRRSSGCNSVCFSPDGTILGFSSKTVMLLDLARTDGKTSTVHRHEKSVNSVAFSPDGTMFASADFGGAVKLWSLSRQGSAIASKRTTSVPTQGATIRQRMQLSAQASRRRDFPAAIGHLEKVFEKESDHREALYAMANATHRYGLDLILNQGNPGKGGTMILDAARHVRHLAKKHTNLTRREKALMAPSILMKHAPMLR